MEHSLCCRDEKAFPAMKIHSPAELFLDQLREIHGLEIQLQDSLPFVTGHCSDRELANMLVMQAFRTGKHAERIAAILRSQGQESFEEVCPLIKGLIADGHRRLAQPADRLTRDMVVIAHCLRVQHHAQAFYTTACALAVSSIPAAEWRLLEAVRVEHVAATRRLEELAARLFGTHWRKEAI